MKKILTKGSIIISIIMLVAIIIFLIANFAFPESSVASLVFGSVADDGMVSIKDDELNLLVSGAGINNSDKSDDFDMSNWRIYRNVNLGFELKYPAEWLSRDGDWNQKVDLLYDANDNNVVSAQVYSRNLDLAHEDTLEKAVKEYVLNFQPGIIGIKQVANVKIKDDSEGIGYYSAWKLYFVNSKGERFWKIHIRADVESVKTIIKRNGGSYRTVYTFILNPAGHKYASIFEKIVSTIKIFK